MKTLIRARSLAVLLAAMLGGLLSAKPAQAARFVKFGIFLNGQYILVAGTYDNGHTDKDGQWDYLKKLPLTTPRGVDFAELDAACGTASFCVTIWRAQGRPSASTRAVCHQARRGPSTPGNDRRQDQGLRPLLLHARSIESATGP